MLSLRHDSRAGTVLTGPSDYTRIVPHDPAQAYFYYQTGQIERAHEVLDRFKGSNAGGLDVQRIEQVLAQSRASSSSPNQPLSNEARQQLLQFALVIADRTL